MHYPASRARLLLVASLFVAPAANAQTAAFSDVTPPIMSDNDWGEGVAWGDYDNDGDLDLLVSNEGQFLRLFRNDGGSFTLATPPGLTAAGTWTGIAWGDLDNDGDLDLIAGEAERPSHIYRNNGGVFAALPIASLTDSAHTHGVSWVDYDRDGRIDVFMARAPVDTRLFGHQEVLLHNDGGGAFSDATPALLQDPQYGTGCSWADADGDGDPDLCIGNNGTTRLFRNDGGGAFTDVTPPPLAPYGHAGGPIWGDYDNDGDFDLFVPEGYTATNRLLRNDGGGVFTDVTTPVLAPAENCLGAQWGDYDNDGDLDLFVGGYPGAHHLFRNDGGVFTDVANAALSAPSNALGSGWADYDGDGDLDLYIANSAGQPDRLLRNDLANGNHWLQLDLEGEQSNRSGIDARILIWAGGVRQIRRVEGGGGYNSQNTLRVHFGLGTAAVVDTLRVLWPSGVVQDSAMVPADRLLRMHEHQQRLAVPIDGRVAGARLAPVSPNPFRAAIAIEYELADAAEAELRVIDLQGRTVRVLAPAALHAAGRHRVEWDGRAVNGRTTRPGIYWVRLTTQQQVLVRPAVRLGD